MKYRIRIEAGRHDRRNCPVEIGLPGFRPETPHSIQLPGPLGGADIAPGPDAARAILLIPELDAGETIEFDLDTAAPPAAQRVALHRENRGRGEVVAVRSGGEEWTRFVADPALARPFFYPVLDPRGAPVTRSFPMRTGVPGENEDHPHHRSFYVAHGLVNDHDFWSETPGHGSQKLEQACDLRNGWTAGELRARVLWIPPEAGPVLRDERIVRFYAVDTIRLLDVTLELRADFGPVRFGDTKEGGLLAFRVAGTMKGTAGGTIRNACGALGESECWGSAAPWVDYSGPAGDHVAGIQVMDHPLNFRYPSRWHVRDYGLFAANPFALSYYKKSFETDGSYTLPAGERLTMRYRVLIHTGEADPAAAAAAFVNYAHPPKATAEPLA